jgi:hypothetical protein
MNKAQRRQRQTHASKAVQKHWEGYVGFSKQRHWKSWAGQSTNQKSETKTDVTLQGREEAWMIGIIGGE